MQKLEKRKEKCGLVLEGGAMRGMYTAAILDCFLEQGIHMDEIIGVSAGALFGVNFLSGQKGRVIRYNKRFNTDKNYMGLRPLLREGNIVSTQYAYRTVPFELDPFDNAAYRRSGVPFFAVMTELRSGKPEYVQIHDVFLQMDVLRASGSLPFVSKPVRIYGKEYLDGGITDSIPFRFLSETRGCEKLVVVLTRDPGYRKKPMSPLLLRLYARKYPKLADCLARRHIVYNESVETLLRWEREGRAFLIRPSEPITIRRIETDPEKLQAVYELGLRDAEKYLPALRAYLA